MVDQDHGPGHNEPARHDDADAAPLPVTTPKGQIG
jgi:hypothetical protein